MFVAFVWTVFPSPLSTDRSWIRRETSTALYLLANYFGVVDETLRSKLRDNDSSTPSSDLRLRATRETIFAKLAEILPSIEDHLRFQAWEPALGGTFPREVYEDIIVRARR